MRRHDEKSKLLYIIHQQEEGNNIMKIIFIILLFLLTYSKTLLSNNYLQEVKKMKTEKLIANLTNKNNEHYVRFYALRELVKRKEKIAIPYFKKIILEDKDTYLVEDALNAFLEIEKNKNKKIEIFQIGLKMTNKYILSHVISRLEDYPFTELIPIVKSFIKKNYKQLFKDFSFGVAESRYIIEFCYKVKNKETIQLLILFLKDNRQMFGEGIYPPPETVNERALKYLKKLTGKDFGLSYDKWDKWWKNKGKKFKLRKNK